MKKLLCMLLALSLLICTAALAEGTYDEGDKTASTTLTTTIEDPSAPAYTIMIPSTIAITPNATSTQLDVRVMEVKNVQKITVTTAASGSMTSTTGGNIAFTVGSPELAFTNFSSLPDNQWMTINITAEEWQQAQAGDYTGVMSFTISVE